MNRINADIILNILDFVPVEDIYNNMEGLYRLNFVWKSSIYELLNKKPIFHYYDLRRKYSSLHPFQQSDFWRGRYKREERATI